ncbi:MAG TPA: 4-hydroxy-tetrahydrodipicolinate reductase [Thermoleophilia bacterium]|nr:4-hydroxy-tetrahydrodipicolinate reductase [Thermoleophilia bacterium]
MTDVLVTGAAGKMGALSARTIAAQADLRLAALVDPRKGDGGEVPWFKDVASALALTTPGVALEFSVPGAVYENSAVLLDAGVPTVVGATGLTDDQVADLSARAAASGAGLVVVPNFALGAVLLMKFAAEAARHYQHAEIIETHEKGKVDAPSGTSLRTARLMAEAPGSSLAAPPGAGQTSRGLVAHDRVTIHSVRLPGAVAHQEVVFGGEDELLTLRHDSLSRRSFMPGVLLALRKVPEVKGTVIGLENLLS